MEKHTFSIEQAVVYGIQQTWKCKWTALGITASLLVGFVIITGTLFAALWLIDKVFMYHISGGLISMTGLAGIDQVKAIAPFFHMITYGVFSVALAGLLVTALSKYWAVKMFVIQAKTSHVAWRDVMADHKGFLSVFLGQGLLNFAIYTLIFIIGFALILMIAGTSFVWANAYLLIPVAAVVLLITILIFWLRLRYFACFIIDQHQSAFTSLGSSHAATRGHWFGILLYLLLYMFMFIILGIFGKTIAVMPTSMTANIAAALMSLIYIVLVFILNFSIHASDVYVYSALTTKTFDVQ